MSQQDLLINRLQQGWLDSLQAATECACLKLTTRVNEPFFIEKIEAMGLRLCKQVKTGTRYVMYKLERCNEC